MNEIERISGELNLERAARSEAIEQQQSIATVLEALSSMKGGDPSLVLDAIAASAATLTRAQCAAVVQIRRGTLGKKWLDVAAAATTTGAYETKLRSALHLLPFEVPEPALNGKSESSAGGVILARLYAEFPDPQYEVAIRLILRPGKAKPIGAVLAIRDGATGFIDKHRAALTMLARHAEIAIENARLFNGTKQALERQTATADILKAISRSPTDTQPVFEAIIETAVRLGAADYGSVVHLEAGVLKVRARFSVKTEPHSPTQREFELQRSNVLGRAILDREVINLEDFSESEFAANARHRAKELGTRGTVAVPMLLGDQPVGAIVIARRIPGSFSEDYVALLKTFADQAVIAIENARLFNETKETLAQQTATANILSVISGALTSAQPVFSAIVRSCHKLFEGSRASLALVRNETLDIRASVDGPGEPESYEMPLDRASASGTSILDSRVIHLPNLETAVAEFPRLKEGGLRWGYRSGLFAPLIQEGKAIGGISVLRPKPGAFNDKELALLKTFADQAVIAIENARLFKELEARNKDLGESLEQQMATSQVLSVISRTTTDLAPVLQIVLDNACRLCDATHVQIFRPKENGEFVTIAASGDVAPEMLALLNEKPIQLDRSSATGRALLDRRTIHIPDFLADSDYGRGDLAQASEALAYRSILAVPMLREGQPIGVLTVARVGEPRPFNDKQIALMTTFADQAVIAIENVRLFNEIQDKTHQLEVANKHKSDFLAHMSHELRTPLNAVIGFSEVLIDKMFGEVNEKQLDYLKDIHESGKHLLSLINDILDLSKIEAGRMELEVSKFHLPTALSNAMTLVRERAQRHGIQLGSQIDERLGDFEGDERKLKQIMLNLLSNAVKFTPDGGRVDVRARLDTDCVLIAIADTGIGITPGDQERLFEEFRQVGGDSNRKAEGTGLGLALTRRLARLHGGDITVTSETGKGSTFTVMLPLDRASAGVRETQAGATREA